MIPELVFVALDFYREPRRFPGLIDPRMPLPVGITELLAAPTTVFSDEQIDATSATLNASLSECREMVPFFIKRMLIDSGGDYYRMLGLTDGADTRQIKQHYHYLIRLFHPDRDEDKESWDDSYAPRINEAYNTLRNADKRSEYDRLRQHGREFSPSETTSTSPAAYRAPSRPSAHFRVPNKGRMSPWLKKFVLLLAILVPGVLIMLSLYRTEQPVLRVETDVEPAPVAGLSKSRPANHSVKMEGEALEGAVPGSEPTIVAGYQAEAQKRVSVEELVRQQVARATAAVMEKPSKIERDREPAQVENPVELRVVKREPAPAAMHPDGLEGLEKASNKGAPQIERRQVQAPPQPQPQPQPQVMSPQGIDAETAVKIEALSKAETGRVKTVKEPGIDAGTNAKSRARNEADIPGIAKIEVKTEPEPEVLANNSLPSVETIEINRAVSAPAATQSVIVEKQSVKAENTSSKKVMPVVLAAQKKSPQSSHISQVQVLQLLAILMSSYEQGNLNRFMSLFAKDAQITGAYDKSEIYRYYRQYFARPEQRKITISSLSWKNIGTEEKLGTGELHLRITPDAKDLPSSNRTGRIKLGIRLYPAGLKIHSMYHEGIGQ